MRLKTDLLMAFEVNRQYFKIKDYYNAFDSYYAK